MKTIHTQGRELLVFDVDIEAKRFHVCQQVGLDPGEKLHFKIKGNGFESFLDLPKGDWSIVGEAVRDEVMIFDEWSFLDVHKIPEGKKLIILEKIK